jgi:hypothetical protein
MAVEVPVEQGTDNGEKEGCSSRQGGEGECPLERDGEGPGFRGTNVPGRTTVEHQVCGEQEPVLHCRKRKQHDAVIQIALMHLRRQQKEGEKQPAAKKHRVFQAGLGLEKKSDAHERGREEEEKSDRPVAEKSPVGGVLDADGLIGRGAPWVIRPTLSWRVGWRRCRATPPLKASLPCKILKCLQ